MVKQKVIIPLEPAGYFGCTFGGATLVAIFVLIRWRAAEALRQQGGWYLFGKPKPWGGGEGLVPGCISYIYMIYVYVYHIRPRVVSNLSLKQVLGW